MRILLRIQVQGRDPGSLKPAPKGLLRAFQNLQVTQGDSGGDGNFRQGFQLTLRAERGHGVTTDYALLEDKSLALYNRIVFSITLNAKEFPLFDGIISHRQVTLGGTNEPGLNLSGGDVTILMAKENKDRDLHTKGDHKIAQEIIERYKKYGVQAKVTALEPDQTRNENERTWRQDRNDLAMLQMLAQHHSFVFLIQPGPTIHSSTGYWGKLDKLYRQCEDLRVNWGTQTNVASLQIVEDRDKPVRTKVGMHQDDSIDPLKFDIDKSTAGTSLAETPALGGDPTNVRSERVLFPGTQSDEARAEAQSRTNFSTQEVVSISGSVDTFRYGTLLWSPGKVKLDNAGQTYDGDYYVRSVTHSITRSEYKQSFQLAREGVDSKLKNSGKRGAKG